MTVYEIITDKIVKMLEEGTVPWRMSWDARMQMPVNWSTGKPYRGLNVFTLILSKYHCQEWITRKRLAMIKGARIKDGEERNGSLVIFWNWMNPGKNTNIADGDSSDLNPTKKPKMIPFLRYYIVYNVLQCEGISPKWQEERKEREFTPIQTAQNIVTGYQDCPDILHDAVKCFYEIGKDRIRMPLQTKFTSDEEYYASLFHEMIHSTGHSSRLNRKELQNAREGNTESRGQEELIAEIGASFLCGHAGIAAQTIENTAGYIDTWIKALKADSKMVVYAAARGQKAAEFITGKQEAVEEEEAA